MHPSQAETFEWDAANERELTRHRITPREVIDVFESGPVWLRNKRQASGNWRMVGRTGGGRVLTVIVLYRSETRTLRQLPAGTRREVSAAICGGNDALGEACAGNE